MIGFAAVCLLSFALGACADGKKSNQISFPVHSVAAEIPQESPADSASVRARYPEGIEAVQSIANVVLKVLQNEEVQSSPKNWVVSPLTLTAMIAQLLLGSRGHLQSVLVDSLSFEGGVRPTSRLEVHRQLGRLMKYVERASNESYTLELNGILFIQPGILLKPTYRHALLDFYSALIEPTDFLGRAEDSVRKINEWVRTSTHGRLPELFPRPLPETTVSLLANIIYFSGTWEVPFEPDFTKSGPFYIGNNRKVEAKYMYGEKEVLYKNTSEMQIIGIPYRNREVVLYVLLPHDKLQGSLSVTRLDEIISSAEKENITLLLPKIKMVSTISVKQSVLKYLMKSDRLSSRTVIISRSPSATANRSGGTPPTANNSRPGATPGGEAYEEDVFGDAENFDVGGASEDGRFRIDDVVHQVSMEIDETGAQIAAVTSTLVDYSGVNFLLKVDRPFWFFVRHEITSTHLFWGRIVDPNSDRN